MAATMGISYCCKAPIYKNNLRDKTWRCKKCSKRCKHKIGQATVTQTITGSGIWLSTAIADAFQSYLRDNYPRGPAWTGD
jgi:hypothetical protein